MGKNRKRTVKKPTPPHNEPSTTNRNAANAQAEEPRVPPLPELPQLPVPPYPQFNRRFQLEDDSLSNRTKKLLSKIQLAANKKGPGHMKVRTPAGTPLTSPRVPPTGSLHDVTCRFFENPAPSPLEAIQASSSRILATHARAIRTIQPPITPGFFRRQLEIASIAAGHNPTPESSSSASSSQSFDFSVDDAIPSLTFTPSSDRGETSSQSPQELESQTEACASPEDAGQVTSAQLKVGGKFETEATLDCADREMDLLARAVDDIQLDDESASVSPPEPFYDSESQSYVEDSDETRFGVSEESTGSVELQSAQEDQTVSFKDLIESYQAHISFEPADLQQKVAEIPKDENFLGKIDNIAGIVENSMETFITKLGLPADSPLAVNIITFVEELRGFTAIMRSGSGDAGSAGQRSNVGADATPGNDDAANEQMEVQSSQVGDNDCLSLQIDDQQASFSQSEVPQLESDGSSSVVCEANEQEEAAAQPKKRSDSPVEDSSISGDEEADEQLEALIASSPVEIRVIPISDGESATVEESDGIPVGSGEQTDVQASASHPREAADQKSDDDQQIQSEDGVDGAVEGSEEHNDVISVADNEGIVIAERQDVSFDGEMLTNLEDGRLQIQFITESDIPVAAKAQPASSGNKFPGPGGNGPPKPDGNGSPGPGGNGSPGSGGNGPPGPDGNGPPGPNGSGPPGPDGCGPPGPDRNGPPGPDGNGPPEPDGNGPPESDLNAKPPHLCPAKLYCLQACRLRTHLSTCWQPFCKVKYCWQMTQVVAHWIHCVERDCEICPPLGKNDAENVRKKVNWLKEIMNPEGLRRHIMEQEAEASDLCNFLTSEGQHVVLAYFTEYYFEAWVAYSTLATEAGTKALNFVNEQVSENMMEAVRHSCHCALFNNCRDNQCHRLKIVITHWAKWNGICFSPECRLCEQLYKRSANRRDEIGELYNFIKSKSNSGKVATLQSQLTGMVKKPDIQGISHTNLNWKDSHRWDFKNACVNTCIYTDAGYDDLKGNADETLDLATVFNNHPTYQLLVMTRFLLHKAISFKEEQLYAGSSSLATYYKNSMDEGVKLINAVHNFVKNELSTYDDIWDDGNPIMSTCHLSQYRRVLMQMSSKMGNKMIDYAAAGHPFFSRRDENNVES